MKSYAARFLVLLALLALSRLVMGVETRPSSLASKTLDHENIERTYHVHLPSGFTKKAQAPLVLVLHGGGGQGRFFEAKMGGKITAAADKRGMVLVFPDGINRQWNDGRKEPLKENEDGTRGHDDVGFLSKLIDQMILDYGCDPKRVYATGISNGGFMSIRMAMDKSDKLAAVAPVTAQVSESIRHLRPAHPVSVMLVNGTEDPMVPYDGGHVRLFKFGKSRGQILSTDDTISIFRKANGCSDRAVKRELPDADPKDGTRVEVIQYRRGSSHAEVTLVKVIGGGHTWPGGNQYLNPRLVGRVSRDFDATEMIFDFFLAHPSNPLKKR